MRSDEKSFDHGDIQRGDIIFIYSPRGTMPKKAGYGLVRFGLEYNKNENSDIVHAAIAIAPDKMIGIGTDYFGEENIYEKRAGCVISVLRCVKKDVAELASDLIQNLLKDVISGEFNRNISYAFMKAFLSAFANKAENEDSEKINSLLNNLDIPSKLFCSELIVIIYIIAYRLFDKDQFNIKFISNPSTLYNYLKNYENEFANFNTRIPGKKENLALALGDEYSASIRQAYLEKYFNVWKNGNNEVEKSINLLANYLESKSMLEQQLTYDKKNIGIVNNALKQFKKDDKLTVKDILAYFSTIQTSGIKLHESLIRRLVFIAERTNNEFELTENANDDSQNNSKKNIY